MPNFSKLTYFRQISKLINSNFKIIFHLDWDKFTSITSGHLIIPFVYSKFKEGNLNKTIPEDLMKYFGHIHEINNNRNIKCMQELNELKAILNYNNIDYCFLKGSALILGNYYKKIGERMIGDIDILVAKNDFYKLITVLKKKGYKRNSKYDFFNPRHYNALVKKNKLFRVEVHNEVLLYKYQNLLRAKNILKKKTKTADGFFIPNPLHLLQHCILNAEINDFGYKSASFNFRSIIDYHKILSKNTKTKINLSNNEYIKSFDFKMEYVGNKIKPIIKTFHQFRIVAKIKWDWYSKIDSAISKTLWQLSNKPDQIKEIFLNKEYRRFARKKISGYF